MEDRMMFAVVAALLAINGYFLKGLVASLNAIKVQLATLVSEHSALSKTVDRHEQMIIDLGKASHNHGVDLARFATAEFKIEELEKVINKIHISLAKIQEA